MKLNCAPVSNSASTSFFASLFGFGCVCVHYDHIRCQGFIDGVIAFGVLLRSNKETQLVISNSLFAFIPRHSLSVTC